MKLLFLKGILSRRGWSYQGTLPKGLKRFILLVGPHTSWRDFLIGLCMRSDLEIFGMKFLAKSNLFFWPFSIFLRSIGAIPVKRGNSSGIVNRLVQDLVSKERFILALAPEGTRSRVESLKSGYYNISRATGLPIICLGMDFKRRIISISTLYQPSNLLESNNHIIKIFGSIDGKNPDFGLGHLIDKIR
tara:strand:- start:16885 stop:17451 length:567 start_codon:yes stop_codon:yes gene_type:complete